MLLEVALPVELTAPQAACYRTVLTRFYELLSDPKPPRHSGHRWADPAVVDDDAAGQTAARMCAVHGPRLTCPSVHITDGNASRKM